MQLVVALTRYQQKRRFAITCWPMDEDCIEIGNWNKLRVVFHEESLASVVIVSLWKSFPE